MGGGACGAFAGTTGPMATLRFIINIAAVVFCVRLMRRKFIGQ